MFKKVSRIVAPSGDLEETLTEIEGSELQSIVAKFNDVFMMDPSELGCTDVVNIPLIQVHTSPFDSYPIELLLLLENEPRS